MVEQFINYNNKFKKVNFKEYHKNIHINYKILYPKC